MSTLLTNGCSFVECWPVQNSLVKSLECDNFVNLGLRGGSLQRVVRSTIEWIAQNGNPKFVIVAIPLVSRWELSIAQTENKIDGTWYPMQIKSSLEKEKISKLVDFDRLCNLVDLYYGCIPDIRTFWDSCFTNLILLSSFLEQNKIDYLIFNMCNKFNKKDLKDFYGKNDYQGFKKLKFIEENKRIVDLFEFCGNLHMWQNMDKEFKKEIDPYMHHHDSKEYQNLENHLLNYRKLYL